MPSTVLVGAQWGDEGKGKITDLIASDYDYVVRYQGGNNAGHTVIHGDKKLALHLMPDRLESLNDIAKRRNLSEKYLERIMKLLKEAGLVKSVRGAYGGYCLTKEPGEISVLEVLRAAEGQLAPVSCLVENTECGMECEICSTKSTWGEMWEQILDTAAEVTVADIAEIVKKKETC